MSDTLHDRIAPYLLGELSPADTAAFEAELARNPVLATEVESQREAITLLALASPVTPRAGLRAEVLARATSATPTATVLPMRPARDRSATWLVIGLAASVVLAAATVLQLRRANLELAATVAVRDSIGAELAERDSLLARLLDPAVETFTLVANTAATPMVQVMMDRARRKVMLAAVAMPAIPADREYQLWILVDGTPLPSVTFRPGTGGRAMDLDVPMPEGGGTVTGFGVTLEPIGGSPTPTLPVLYAASVTE